MKDVIRRGLTAYPTSFWSDHLNTALMMLRFTCHKMTGYPPFTMITGSKPRLPSVIQTPLDDLPDELSREEEDAFCEKMF